MNADEAIRQALREAADPACPRCRGAGVTGRDLMADLCRCVPRRVPKERESGESSAGKETPHPWGFITRRAEEIQAAAKLGSAPLKWR